MEELFRLKLVGDRRMTVSQRLLNLLGFEEGDELWITMDNDKIKTVEPNKSRTKVDPVAEERLANRVKEIENGRQDDPSRIAKILRPATKTATRG